MKNHIIENINLDRYVNLPQEEDNNISPRVSHDKHINSFGQKLLNLLKENNMQIYNGRLDDGMCTYYNKGSNRTGSSLVDYIISNYKNVYYLNAFQVLEINEFSDHCAIHFEFNCVFNKCTDDNDKTLNKVYWDSSKRKLLLSNLETKKHVFDEIVNKISNSANDFDENILKFSGEIYKCSFEIFGRRIKTSNKYVKHKNKWFDDSCKKMKKDFLNSKRAYKTNRNEENLKIFLEKRS